MLTVARSDHHAANAAPKAQSRPQFRGFNVTDLPILAARQSETQAGVISSSLVWPSLGVFSLNLEPQPTQHCAAGAFLRGCDNFRPLFKLGLRTDEIATLFGVTEAQVYNHLARIKS